MSLEYQSPSSIEILGSRVSRDSCPQTMLDLRGSFQLSGLKGLVSIRCKEREGCTRPCSCSSLLFLVGRRERSEKGSHKVLEKSPWTRSLFIRLRSSFLSHFVSFFGLLLRVSSSNFSIRAGDIRWLFSEKDNNSAISEARGSEPTVVWVYVFFSFCD